MPNRLSKYLTNLKTISLQDISKELNFSKATISYVLNGKGDEKRISKETQEKILKFAKEHNYKANQLARSLSRGKSDMIGLIVPNISDTFFASIARRIEIKAEQSGYDVIFSSTGENIENETKIIQSMLERKVDGLILASCQKNKEGILRLKKHNFPFVLIDRQYPEIETNFVGLDNDTGIALAVQQLIKSGRKRIGFVSVSIGLETLHERLAGYLHTMEKYGFHVEENFVQKLVYEREDVYMRKAIKKMVQSPASIDGIVFATQYLAAEALRVLKEMKIQVPEDIAVVSFGQKKDFDLFEPAISAVSLPINEMGDIAVDMLLHNMKESKSTYENVRLKTELIVRKSCGAI